MCQGSRGEVWGASQAHEPLTIGSEGAAAHRNAGIGNADGAPIPSQT